MLLPNISLDFLNLLFLPLMGMTIVQSWQERQSLWDNELTSRDRFLLQRIVIFLLLPVVVFLHECGHAAATEYFGGTVKQFHYAFFWGYVIPSGNFSSLQVLIIYLAGNVVQAGIGILALLMALPATSPPVVALLVYLGLWSAAGTLVLYALLSFSGLYGDWIAIYNAPIPHLVIAIGVVHAVLVAALLYLIYGDQPRLWFARKTLPRWAREEAALKHSLQIEPSASSWVALGWCYFRIGLYKRANQCLMAAQSLDPQLPDLTMLQGALLMQAKNYQPAVDNFISVVNNEHFAREDKVRSLLALADCYAEMRKLSDAESAYMRALELDPGCGDTRYLLSMLLAKSGRIKEVESQLLAQDITYWLDSNLQARYETQRHTLQKRIR